MVRARRDVVTDGLATRRSDLRAFCQPQTWRRWRLFSARRPAIRAAQTGPRATLPGAPMGSPAASYVPAVSSQKGSTPADCIGLWGANHNVPWSPAECRLGDYT